MTSTTSAGSAAPTLTTARLTLRAHQVADFPDCLALWTDPTVTRYIGGRPSTQEEVWGRLLRYAGHWALLGFGYWAVCEQESGRFVGELGFADYHRDLTPALDGAPEIGWALAPAVHGQGFATEAVCAVLAWGDTHFGAARTVCLIDPDNQPSLRVAAKCGYREYARTTYKGDPTILFERRPGA
jgi:RimJ/RimL family protein N-acetyltransferase